MVVGVEVVIGVDIGEGVEVADTEVDPLIHTPLREDLHRIATRPHTLTTPTIHPLTEPAHLAIRIIVAAETTIHPQVCFICRLCPSQISNLDQVILCFLCAKIKNL